MKIGDIYNICKSKYNLIDEIKISDDGFTDNIELISKNLLLCEDIKNIDFMKSTYEDFIQLPAKIILSQNIINYTEYEDYKYAKLQLLSMMNCIIQLYERAGLPPQKEIGLDIKFPINGTFSEFRKNVDELDFVLTKCPFFQHQNENLRFDNVDIGSFWLTFAVIGGTLAGGSILLNNIAAFVDKCIVIRSHYLTTEKQKMELEKAQIDQKQKEELLQYLDKIYKITIDNAINELEQITSCHINDGDERGRAEQSLEKMGKLLDKGMQLHASIDSPQEIKALFKPLEMYYLDINKKINLLEQKEESED